MFVIKICNNILLALKSISLSQVSLYRNLFIMQKVKVIWKLLTAYGSNPKGTIYLLTVYLLSLRFNTSFPLSYLLI